MSKKISLSTFPRIALIGLILLSVFAPFKARAAEGDIWLASVASDSTQGNDVSWFPSISANGRYVAFHSDATNLVPDDTNSCRDVFVHDNTTGVTVRVSIASDGSQGNGASQSPAISADGRFVAFQSDASNLAAGDTNGFTDIFLHDRDADVDGVYDEPGAISTIRVSVGAGGVQANDRSIFPAISNNGTVVAFASAASNLVAGDTNAKIDIFVYEISNAQTTRVSVDSSGQEAQNGDSFRPSLSGDGNLVAFYSFSDTLVDDDTNGRQDAFVHNRNTGATIRISVDSLGNEGDQDSYYPSISADGNFVAFVSEATNLVDNDTNACEDIFVYNLSTGEIRRASVNGEGAQANDGSYDPVISQDGRYVAFWSRATNLVGNDTNDVEDVFLHDLITGRTSRVSVGVDGQEGNDSSVFAAISANGRFVVFQSDASNLVPNDTNDKADIFVQELDITPPSIVSIVRSSPTGQVVTSGDSVTYRVTFSEPVDGVDTADFNLTMLNALGSNAFISAVTAVDSNTYDVTVDITGLRNAQNKRDGAIRLDVPATATITDFASHSLSGLPYTGGQIYSIVQEQTFGDVASSYWAWISIERLYYSGITSGCGNGNYCPETPVTRAQMAVFLERGMRGASYTPLAGSGAVFGDVPPGYWALNWVEQLFADRITSGCGNGNYCPENPVTRAQMAVFLLRAKHGSAYTPPTASGTVFTDIPTDYWAAAWVEQLYAEGITSGCGGGNYCPESPVTRAQMAVFLLRAFGLP